MDDSGCKVANVKEHHGEPVRKSKIDILREALDKPCSSDTCRWLPAALEVLERNNIARAEWARIVTDNLKYGRAKGFNLMVVGPTNSAKTFMLMPLVDIFDTFVSPAEGKLNWVGATTKDLVLLDDFRYGKDGDQEVMQWEIFLNLLDGRPVTIAQPRSHPAIWRSIQPIFATSDEPIRRITPDGQINPGETDQMDQRWVVKLFHYQFTYPDCTLKRCARCFAHLILDEE